MKYYPINKYYQHYQYDKINYDKLVVSVLIS